MGTELGIDGCAFADRLGAELLLQGAEVDGAQTYDYTLPMAIFAVFGVLALIVSLMLKAENRKKGYGLEEANIKKNRYNIKDSV